MKWINIIGLIFQFLAFWFAAPELLGSESLRRFEKGLIALIGKIPTVIITFSALAIGGGMSWYGINTGLEASEKDATGMIYTMITIIVLSVVIMVYFIFFAGKTQRWIQAKMATPLVEKLIMNGESRKSALIAGAVLFTLGFVMQLVVALLQ
jgi:hypothetical protein